jgi:hypothetical protein
MGRFGFLPTKYPPKSIPVDPEIPALKQVLCREHRRKILKSAAQGGLQAVFMTLLSIPLSFGNIVNLSLKYCSKDNFQLEELALQSSQPSRQSDGMLSQPGLSTRTNANRISVETLF